MQKYPKNLGHVEKLHFQVIYAVATFWAIFWNIGPIFIPTSGHTDHM